MNHSFRHNLEWACERSRFVCVYTDRVSDTAAMQTKNLLPADNVAEIFEATAWVLRELSGRSIAATGSEPHVRNTNFGNPVQSGSRTA